MKRKTLAEDPHDDYITNLEDLAVPHLLRRMKLQPSMQTRGVNSFLGFSIHGSQIERFLCRIAVYEKNAKMWHLRPEIMMLDMEHMTETELMSCLRGREWTYEPARKKMKVSRPGRASRSTQPVMTLEELHARYSTTNTAGTVAAVPVPPMQRNAGPAANLETVSLAEVAKAFALEQETSPSTEQEKSPIEDTQTNKEEEENANPTELLTTSLQDEHPKAILTSDLSSVPAKGPVISTTCLPSKARPTNSARKPDTNMSAPVSELPRPMSFPRFGTMPHQHLPFPRVSQGPASFPPPQGPVGGGLLQASIAPHRLTLQCNVSEIAPCSTTATLRATPQTGNKSAPSLFSVLAPRASPWSAPWKTSSKLALDQVERAVATGILDPWKKSASIPVVPVRPDFALWRSSWEVSKRKASGTAVRNETTDALPTSGKPSPRTSCDVALQVEVATPPSTSKGMFSDRIEAPTSSFAVQLAQINSLKKHGTTANPATQALLPIDALLKYGEHEACMSIGITDSNTGAVHTHSSNRGLA